VGDSVTGNNGLEQLRRRALPSKHSHLTRAGRKLRDELEGKVPEDLRITVLGPGDVSGGLRKALEAPGLPLGHSLVLEQRDDKKRPAHGEDPHDADTPGTPERRALVSQPAIAGGVRATVSIVPYGQLPVRS
jgi:hypothetical protein